jgi:flavodoxin
MKTLIIFDSMYGNTEKIAKAVASGISGDIKVLKAGEAHLLDIINIGLLVLGLPTQGGRYTKPIAAFLNEISGQIKKGTIIAFFDTRMPSAWVKIFGFAAGKMADYFKKEGFQIVVPPEPFFVQGAQGPLQDGEPERAVAWGKDISLKIK